MGDIRKESASSETAIMGSPDASAVTIQVECSGAVGVRARLAQSRIEEADVAEAIAWARQTPAIESA